MSSARNFLHDRAVIRAIVDVVSRTDGPIVEIGAGNGALTLPLQTLGRPLTPSSSTTAWRHAPPTAPRPRRASSARTSCTTGYRAHRT
jgi:23S rRNA (adenine-N6)-dimethyltransferase